MKGIDRKGIELSVNFIVTLIIAITVFSLGIYFLRGISGKSEDFLKMKSEDFVAQLDDIACEGSEFVCVGITEKEVRQGGIVVFTLNVLNHYSEARKFKASVDILSVPSSATDANVGTKIQTLPSASGEEHEIASGNLKKIPIAVHPLKGASLGTYQLKIDVSESGTSYGTALIYVIVK